MTETSRHAPSPPSDGCEECGKEVDTLEKRTFKTYEARLRACERLSRRARAWNALMISASLASLIASAAMLRNPKVYGPNGDLLWLFVAIITLAASLIISSINYSGRSRDMFLNYRKIQSLSSELEFIRVHGAVNHDHVVALKSSYNALLDESENHTTADFLSTKTSPQRTTREKLTVAASWALDYAPWIAVILPTLLLIPPLKIVLHG
ncbi:hypothetical protein GA0061083_2864 [Pseudarthrobacter enclensis]|uniref:SLATT domain-containing protein n=1 Tax=Pseudarthrobacter enclensis TaxID=993070 RepID=UPI000815745D|nr:SLATT domain-containing protein [Pseudarthrobacter enclensis]SCC13799.1 hypothetical protein GA0061083_2864 [Pseudarthrobacter enclensis]